MESMFITPMNMVQGLNGISGAGSAGEIFGAAEKTEKEGDSLFGSLFGDLINNVKELEDDYMKKQYLLATGQLDDPHTVPIAGAELQLSVDLLVQLRNKALEAYNSLISISM